MKRTHINLRQLVASAIVASALAFGGYSAQSSIYAAAPGSDVAAPDANPQDAPPRPENGGRPRPAPPGMQRAIEQLELSDEQKPAVKAIVDAYRQREQQARAELLKRMKEVLTPEQFEKFESASRRPPAPPQQARSEANDQPARQPAAARLQGNAEVAVTLTGGYDTDPRDHGRPVVLIAAALNVPSDVFRKAFSGVTPARGGEEPQDAQVRLNKQALLRVLGPYGITNDLLDSVSNYYRYSSSRGQMWRNAPASATAIVRNGIVTGFTITNPGAGYSSPPEISVPGAPDLKAQAVLSYGTDFKTNGSIKEITIAPATPADR